MCRLGVWIRTSKKAARLESLNRTVEAWNNRNMTHKDLKSIINKAQMKSAIEKSKNMNNDEVKNNWRRLATALKGYK